jgi:nucleoprotein TPR
MSRTRRRAAAEAQQPSTPEPGPSQDDTEPSDVLAVAIPEGMNQQHLAEILPEIPDLEQITPDVVLFLYELVAKQYDLLDESQRDLDELKAENERKEVELEQAFLEKETLAKDLETSVTSCQEELAQANQARDKLGLYPFLSRAIMKKLIAEPLQRRRTLH